MSYHQTVTRWIDRLGSGDEDAVEIMFTKYFDRLIRLATRKTHGMNQVPHSGEDVTISAVNASLKEKKDRGRLGGRSLKLSFSESPRARRARNGDECLPPSGVKTRRRSPKRPDSSSGPFSGI